jgi:hypothetical protein
MYYERGSRGGLAGNANCALGKGTDFIRAIKSSRFGSGF